MSALIMKGAGIDRSSPQVYQRALMARYSNDAEELRDKPTTSFTASVFKGKSDRFAPRLSMIDFIAR